jgi:hypothetical protein
MNQRRHTKDHLVEVRAMPNAFRYRSSISSSSMMTVSRRAVRAERMLIRRKSVQLKKSTERNYVVQMMNL